MLGVLAQRLVRLLCPYCKRPVKASAADCELLEVPAKEAPTIYTPVGCKHCNNLGYRGRTGIYELVELDDTIRTMIHDGAGEHVLDAHARKSSRSIRQDGMRRVLAGETSLEEVLRVTREG